jgi:hypothetical protein
LQTYLKTSQANTRPISIAIGINRACKADLKEKLFLIPKAFGTNQSKKIKNATHSRHSMTQKLNTDGGLQARWSRTPEPNTILAKVAIQCSADTFVVNKSLVHRINIYGKNRQLLVAPKPLIKIYNQQTNVNQINLPLKKGTK